MRILRVALVVALLAGLASIPAWGGAKQQALWPGLQGEGWVATGPAAVRLISARDGFSPHAAATLGVQIKLRPGWWTYWRAPGDTGMPPDFDWAGSRNLKWAPELFWPKPMQKTSFGHALRVYRDEIVFPIRVVAADPAKPVHLKLDLTFGVCKDVCIPNRAQVSLDIAPNPGAVPPPIAGQMELIRRFEAEVPSANAQRAGFRIQNVGLLGSAGGAQILAVELGRVEANANPLVLVELSPGEAPLIAKSLGRAAPSESWRFAADLDEAQLRDGSLAGRRVRVTIFDGGRSLEQIWVIGASADSSGRFGRAATGGLIADPMKPAEDGWKPRD
jgi:suppressor for copper-sensitivity B